MSANHIGVIHESTLHASIKNWYARPGDLLESQVDGYWIDIHRENQLIEIQTSNFYQIKNKLGYLLERYPVLVVHPVAMKKWIIKVDASGKIISTRKSPRHGSTIDIFKELVRIPNLLLHPNLSIDVLLVEEEEIRLWSATGPWRKRGWATIDHRLVQVISHQIFSNIEDYCHLLDPIDLPYFSTKELSAALQIPRPLGAKILYCFKQIDLVKQIGKNGRANLYTSACDEYTPVAAPEFENSKI